WSGRMGRRSWLPCSRRSRCSSRLRLSARPLSRKRLLTLPQIPVQPDEIAAHSETLRLLDRRAPAPALHPHAVDAEDRTGPIAVDIAVNEERQRRWVLQRGQDALTAAVAERVEAQRHMHVDDAHPLQPPPFAGTPPGLDAADSEPRGHAHFLKL